MDCGNSKISYLPRDKKTAIVYMITENFTYPKKQIMHKELSLALTLLIPCINSLKPDINSIESSVDPDQLASEEAS